MSDENSARLGIPYLVAGQLQKHVTLNEALTRLDELVQASVVSRSIAAQPGAPADGALYILPASPTGSVWATRAAGDLLRYEAGGWSVVPVVEGLRVWIADEARLAVRHAGAWTSLGQLLGAVQSLALFGLNTTADVSNPFAAKLNKALWTALGVGEAGDGDLRMTFNKEAASDVASLLFQSGYSGRAELGLIGDDHLGLKVSTDGSTWRQALTIDRSTGVASFPYGAGRAETTVLTVGATWTVPAWARRVEAVCVGGGGGGGSGMAGAAGSSRYGGGGGGAGGISREAWSAADLAASLVVAVGAGGAGGGLVSSGVGSAGGAGGASTLASAGVVILKGNPGSGGGGGTASAGSPGAGGTGSPTANAGGASSVGGTAGAGVNTTRPDGSGGGGAGGALDSANTVRAGGAGGLGGALSTSRAGGTGGSAATGGAGVSAPTPGLSFSSGGGGGGGASTTTGYAGGAGGLAAGGGGGGAGVTASGAGGAGGGGLVLLTAIG